MLSELGLFDLCKAFVKIERSGKSDFFLSEQTFFLHACTTCSELPSNISTMAEGVKSRLQLYHLAYINF